MAESRVPASAQLVITAPLAGTVVALLDVPDEVFATGLVGAGIAIDPDRSATTASCPIGGVIGRLLPHAFVVEVGPRAVLVHLGINTVELAGAGFEVIARNGDSVGVGHPVISWNPTAVAAIGRSPLVVVVALLASAADLTHLVEVGTFVEAGAALLTWQ